MLPVELQSPCGPSSGQARRRWLPLAAAAMVGLIAASLWALSATKPQAGVPDPERMRGLPQTPADVQAWYADPGPDKNAAFWYEQGFDALRATGPLVAHLPFFTEMTAPPVGTPVPASLHRQVLALLQANQHALECFAHGAELTQSRCGGYLVRSTGPQGAVAAGKRDSFRAGDLVFTVQR